MLCTRTSYAYRDAAAEVRRWKGRAPRRRCWRLTAPPKAAPFRAATAAAAAHTALLETLAKEVAAHQQTHDATQKIAQGAYNTRKREILDSWDERCGITRLLAEERIQKQANELAEMKRASAAATKEDRARYKQLIDADAKESELIQGREIRLREVQAGIAEWQKRLADDAEKWQWQVAQAKGSKSEALEKYSAAQKEVGQSRKAHENKLKAVSVAR